ncbi:MAG: Trp family transcriptional regulator [Candidatus Pacebacteria bacterium]|jgi:DNA-binding NarL/FixJ family response regulator|nr:Trp family transcriptional regulator [Candidatus Paceibacterota bacterium]
MVRLNRNILTNKQLESLFRQFTTAISPGDPSRAEEVLTELLGFEERLMLAKRLAAVVLLVEGVSMYKVGQQLKLSQSTVSALAVKLKKGHFDSTLQQVSKTKKDYFSFLDTLDSILHMGGVLPHYNGLDRYRYMK